MIISLILFVAFILLLTQALIETAWGLTLFTWGMFLIVLGTILNIFTKIAHLFHNKDATTQPAPKRSNVVSAFIKCQGLAAS